MKPFSLIQPGPPALRKSCEACGEPFTCEISSTQGCWCGEVKLSENALLELRAKYGNCLCRACLEKAAKEKQTAAEGKR